MAGAIVLRVDGRDYETWLSAGVDRAMGQEAGQFALSVTERWQAGDEPWPIRPGSRCELFESGERLITGWVDSYEPSISATDHAVSVRGASLTVDLADCSAVVPGGQLSGYSLAAIARLLAGPFGVAVAVEQSAASAAAQALPVVQITQGERVAEVLGRLAASLGLLLWDNAAGQLVIGRAGSARSGTVLRLGDNVLQAQATLSHAGRYSEYILRSQTPGNDQVFGVAAAEVEGRARDTGIGRYRPLLIANESPADPALARRRAAWEAATRMAKGISLRVTVPGWRQDDGRLWAINTLVAVDMPLLGLSRELLVISTGFRLDGSGRRTDLVLTPAEAMTPEPSDPNVAGANGSVWAGLVSIQ